MDTALWKQIITKIAMEINEISRVFTGEDISAL
jgi:hypothetical protein